jgi:hypothetical protein
MGIALPSRDGLMAMMKQTLTNPVDLVRRLTYRIEDAPRTLHLDEGPSHQCRRVLLGYAFSKPDDCTCGLDDLLAEARAFMAAGQCATVRSG